SDLLGTLSIAELAESKRAARQFIATTAIVTGVNGLIAGFGVGLALIYLSPHLRAGLDSYLQLSIFAALSVTTTTSLLLDEASIGLLRGDIQFRRNVLF